MGFLDNAPCEELLRQGEELPSVRSLRYSSWKLRLKGRCQDEVRTLIVIVVIVVLIVVAYLLLTRRRR
jgi:hypothetical protein